MTMNNAYPIAYMILAIVPFSFLQYYPFLNKIRVPKIVIGVMYSVLLLSELILFHNNNYVIFLCIFKKLKIPHILLSAYQDMGFALLYYSTGSNRRLFPK